MPKKTTLFLISVLLIIIAGGCVKPACDDIDYETFQVKLDSPADGETVPYGEPITFNWHHQESCEPYRYILRVYDPVDDFTIDRPTLDNTSELTEGLLSILSLQKRSPVAGRDYHWSVVAAGESWGSVQGDEILRLAFTYGEMCGPGELLPPQPSEPINGSWPAPPNSWSNYVNIGWSYSSENCFPEEFQYQVASDPGFNHLALTGITNFPYHGAKIPVPTCTHLYWRVRSAVGNSSSAWSETYSFYYAYDNNCWFVNSPGDGALIKGFVFKDKCEYTNPIIPLGEDILPPCDVSQYGVHADGDPEITDNSEPGIGDVLVKLGSGACPSTGLDEFSSTNDGLYYFTPKAPGDYCVSISKSDNPDLEDGIWTRPLTDQPVVEKTFTFGSSDEEIHEHFGWDKNDFAKLNFFVEKLSTCRQTDNKNSPAVMYLEEGSVIPVVATNEEKTWYLTKFNCFVSIATGEAEEGDLTLYPEQPIIVIEDQPKPDLPDSGEEKPCSSYTGRGCPYPRCVWVEPVAGPSFCTEN